MAGAVINDFALFTPDRLSNLIDRSSREKSYLGPLFKEQRLVGSLQVQADYWEQKAISLVPPSSHSGPAINLAKGKLSRRLYEPFVWKLKKEFTGNEYYLIKKAMQPGASPNMHRAILELLAKEQAEMAKRMEITKEYLRISCLLGSSITYGSGAFPATSTTPMGGVVTTVAWPSPTILDVLGGGTAWNDASALIVSTGVKNIKNKAKQTTGVPVITALMSRTTMNYLRFNTEVKAIGLQSDAGMNRFGLSLLMESAEELNFGSMNWKVYDTATRDLNGAEATVFLADNALVCLPDQNEAGGQLFWDLKCDVAAPVAGGGGIGIHSELVATPYSFMYEFYNDGVCGIELHLWDSAFPLNVWPETVLYDASVIA